METKEEASTGSTTTHHPHSYSQTGPIKDLSFNTLREQINKVMIPTLIKIFQFKLELSQSVSLPSRIQASSKTPPDQILSQLKNLDEDLRLLQLWCESARNQISKAIKIPEEEQKTFSKKEVDVSSHSSIDVVTKPQFQTKMAHPSEKSPKDKATHENPSPQPSSEEAKPDSEPKKQKWWKRSVSKLSLKLKSD